MAYSRQRKTINKKEVFYSSTLAQTFVKQDKTVSSCNFRILHSVVHYSCICS